MYGSFCVCSNKDVAAGDYGTSSLTDERKSLQTKCGLCHVARHLSLSFLFSVALRDGNLRLTGPSGEHRCHCQQHYTLLGEALLYRCVIFWYCPHFPRSFPKVMLILHIRLTVQSDCLLISYFMHLIKGTSLGNIPNAITLFFWGNVSDFIRTLLLWLQTRKKCFMIVVYSY